MKIDVSWEDNSHQALAYADDSLVLVLYVPENGRFIYHRPPGLRQSLTARVTLPVSYKTKELQMWMAFVRPEEQRASPSVYLGGLEGL